MAIYVFRYQFSPEVTDAQKFQLQLLAVATAMKMGLTDFKFGFEVSASGPIGNYCGVIPNDDPGFEGLLANSAFAAKTAWATPPLAEFTSFNFQPYPGSPPEELPQAV